MDRAAYDQMATLDQRHWWYTARRRVLAALIERAVRPPAGAAILEIGCGTDHNLAMLGQFGTVDALELDEAARTIAEGRLGKPILRSPLPQLDAVPLAHYDFIAALDVIEHIDDDRASLDSIARRLRPGGKFLMTVPAHQWMWSAHDVVNHHKRRYSKARLRDLVAASPMKLEAIGFFNSILFPLAAAERSVSRLRGKDEADLALPARPINAAFNWAFGLERYLVGRVPMPPGLSLFAVASAT